jgi:hypothetical protein
VLGVFEGHHLEFGAMHVKLLFGALALNSHGFFCGGWYRRKLDHRFHETALMDRYIVEPTRFVIPGRRKAANPETITTNWGYGSRVLGHPKSAVADLGTYAADLG